MKTQAGLKTAGSSLKDTFGAGKECGETWKIPEGALKYARCSVADLTIADWHGSLLELYYIRESRKLISIGPCKVGKTCLANYNRMREESVKNHLARMLGHKMLTPVGFPTFSITELPPPRRLCT